MHDIVHVYDKVLHWSDCLSQVPFISKQLQCCTSVNPCANFTTWRRTNPPLRMTPWHQSVMRILCLVLAATFSASGHEICDPPQPLFALGDIIIGLVVSAHDDPLLGCSGQYSLTELLRVEAFIYAIHATNQILKSSNVTLGYVIYDDCGCEETAITQISQIQKSIADGKQQCFWECVPDPPLTNYYLAALIGGSTSEIAASIADTVVLSNMPFITPDAWSATLSNKANYPTLLRTITSTATTFWATSFVVQRFGWNWIGIIVVDTEYGDYKYFDFTAMWKLANVCVAWIKVLPSRFSQESVEQMILGMEDDDNPPDVIILGLSEPETEIFFQFARPHAHLLNKRQWILFNLLGFPSPTSNTTIADLPDGAIGFVSGVKNPQNAEAFSQYIEEKGTDFIESHNHWFYEWVHHQQRSIGLDFTFQLFEKSPSASGFNKNETYDGTTDKYATILDATFAIGLAMITTIEQYGVTSHSRLLNALYTNDLIEPNTTTHSPWFSADGFDGNGDIVGKKLAVRLIAKQDNDTLLEAGLLRIDAMGVPQEIRIDEDSIRWSTHFNNSPPVSRCSSPCEPGTYRVNLSLTCCWSCLECPSGSISTDTDVEECTPCADGRVHNDEHTDCIYVIPDINWKAAEQVVVFVFDCIGFIFTALTFISFLRNWQTPVVKSSNRPLSILLLFSINGFFSLPFLFTLFPTVSHCVLSSLVYYLSTSVSCAVLLVKTWHVWRVFNLTRATALARWFQYIQMGMVALFVFFGMVIEIPIHAAHSISPPVGSRSCGEAWRVIHFTSMGYGSSILLVAAFIAYKARKLPANYNETRHVSWACFVLILLQIAGIPAFYHVTIQEELLIINVCTLAQGFSLLFLMFIPKLAVIYFHPERNTKEYIKRMNLEHVWNTNSWKTLKQRAASARRQSSQLTVSTTATTNGVCEWKQLFKRGRCQINPQ